MLIWLGKQILFFFQKKKICYSLDDSIVSWLLESAPSINLRDRLTSLLEGYLGWWVKKQKKDNGWLRLIRLVNLNPQAAWTLLAAVISHLPGCHWQLCRLPSSPNGPSHPFMLSWAFLLLKSFVKQKQGYSVSATTLFQEKWEWGRLTLSRTWGCLSCWGCVLVICKLDMFCIKY